MPISRITASIEFDPPADSREEALQTLAESVCDDCADFIFLDENGQEFTPAYDSEPDEYEDDDQ